MAAPPPSSQQQHLPARCVLTGMLNAQYNHHVCRRLPQRELHEALRTDTDAKREAVALGNGRVIAVRAEVGAPPGSFRLELCGEIPPKPCASGRTLLWTSWAHTQRY